VVNHLAKMVHFVPRHKEITAEESAYLFVGNCYKLHGVSGFLSLLESSWQSLMGKLNTELNMSAARNPRTDGLTEKVKQTMQRRVRCYCAESGYDWTSHLIRVEFYYNCSINEASTHSPFEVMYGYQPYTPADRLLF